MLRGVPAYGDAVSICDDDFISPWSADIELAAQRVSVELQRLAYMVNAGLISKEHFWAMWGPTFKSSWETLEFWVKRRRFNNSESLELVDGGYSLKDFEVFATAQ